MSKRGKGKSSSNNLPAKRQEIFQVSKSSFHVGPLPAPEVLAKYDEAVPGAAERILSMAERQAEHRQELEKITVKSQSRNSLLGLISGTLLGASGIAAGTYVALSGYSVEGMAGMMASLAALAGVFVYGKHANKKELIEKQKLINEIKSN